MVQLFNPARDSFMFLKVRNKKGHCRINIVGGAPTFLNIKICIPTQFFVGNPMVKLTSPNSDPFDL
jgi:hypothetical protein